MFLMRLLVSCNLLSKLVWAGSGASSGSHLSRSALLSSVNRMIHSLRICRFAFPYPLTILSESSVGVAVGSARTVSLLTFALLLIFCSGTVKVSILSVISSFIWDCDMEGWVSEFDGLIASPVITFISILKTLFLRVYIIWCFIWDSLGCCV